MASYYTLTIKGAIDKIRDRKYFLPAIQREFVWSEKQIKKLFDSIMRGYPIGSFLFWEVKSDSIKKYQFYEFIKDYSEYDNKHNKKANLSGKEEVVAVLDGQQRLTALYIGLLGSYSSRKKYGRIDDPQAYPKKFLYLDITRTYADEMKYRFAFLTDSEAQSNSNRWFKVSDILNFREVSEVATYCMEKYFGSMDKSSLMNAHNILTQLWNKISTEQLINYFLETDQDLDKVLNIFVRVNSGGTQLTYSDLLLSLATAQWTKFDAREEIIDVVEILNKIGFGFSFNKDFVLKSALTLADISSIKFSAVSFNKSNMEKIEKEWSEIKKALYEAVQLVASFGYSRDSLASLNAVIPIAYYIKINQLRIDNITNKNKENIKLWLHKSILKAVFSGTSDTVLTKIRSVIKQYGKPDFPLREIEKEFSGTPKSIKFDEEDIEGLLQLSYGNKTVFSALALLYPTLTNQYVYHIDHIYPKGISKTELKKVFNDEQIEEYKKIINYLPNLQILTSQNNLEKKDKEPKIWIEDTFRTNKEKRSYLENNIIPDDIELTFSNFFEFFEKRSEMLKEKLRNKLL